MPSISYPATFVPFSSTAQPSMMSGGGVLSGGFDGGWDGGGVDTGGLGVDDGGCSGCGVDVPPESGAGVRRGLALRRGSAGAAPRPATRGAEPDAGTAGRSALVSLAGFGFGFGSSPALATA
jgi:hypothetical protein